MREAFGEKERQAGPGLQPAPDVVPNIKNMLMTAGEKARLDDMWTEAFAHAGGPPNAVDDDYVRHAIYETSKIQVPPPPPTPPPPLPPPQT
jgi:hypothetical protein